MKFKLIISPEEEETVVVTAKERSALTDELEALVLHHAGAERICAYTQDEMRLLAFSDIECITVFDAKTYAIDTSARRYRLKQRLYEIEELLPPYFFRINKSTLANEHRLERFVSSFNGSVDAIFKCGYKDYVSRRCFVMIRRRFEKK